MSRISITFLSGCRVGKTKTIQSLWGDFKRNPLDVSENITGRGTMNFTVQETEPVIYSMTEKWIAKQENIKAITEANAIVFILPSVSFGYQEEMTFLETLYSKGYINQFTNIVFAISKVDQVYKRNHKIYETIEYIQHIERVVHKTAENYLRTRIDFENIICYSSLTKCNICLLKEKIWSSIIKNTNNQIFDVKLPTLVVSGKRGCGKSSTLNQLFGLKLPTNMATACTKYPRVLNIVDKDGIAFNLVDLPGIAESLTADIDYIDYYEQYLSKASVLLCLSQADTRAYKQDEIFYKRLIKNGNLSDNLSILIGINQIDLLFKSFENLDGIDLSTLSEDNNLLVSKLNDVYEIHKEIFGDKLAEKEYAIHPFSALKKYNIDLLRTKIIQLLKRQKNGTI